jgi:NADP-dependent 3-hydroxy acid dehydrogenase YdfG
VTTIAPGAVDTDLKHNTTGVAREAVLTLYESAVGADVVSRAIISALQQPPEVNINEIMLRPTTQDFQSKPGLGSPTQVGTICSRVMR